MLQRVSRKISILILLLVLLTSGCSIRQMVVRSATDPIIDGGFKAMMAEDDLELARTSLESNLKLVEGLLASDPGNNRLRLIASQGFTAYALGFVEDTDPGRAVRLYLRGRNYGNRWLMDEQGIDLLSIDNFETFENTVAELPDDAVPGVFWMANAWASSLMLSLTDISSISNLPRVEAMMQFVLDHDETYYFGGAHLFFGAYYGARSTLLGGNAVKARHHLERQQELTNGTMLLGKLFQVKYVDLPALDEEAARTHLNQILTADLDTFPDETRLVNRISQEKARHLLETLEDYL